MSDIEGEKPKAIFKYAKKNKLGFLALEYSGHGKSQENLLMEILVNGLKKLKF